MTVVEQAKDRHGTPCNMCAGPAHCPMSCTTSEHLENHMDEKLFTTIWS